MLNFFRRKGKDSCNHDLYFYHKDVAMYEFGASETKWHFICRKCEREQVVKEIPLINYVHKMRKVISREKALDIDNSKYDNEVFVFDNYRYDGKLAYLMKEKYGMYKFL